MNKVKIWHVGLWFIVLIINMAMMARDKLLETSFFELFCVILYAVVFYINTIWLFPRFYEGKRFWYWVYGLAVALMAFLLIELVSEILWESHHHRSNNWLEKIVTFKQILWIILVFMIGTLFSIQELLKTQILNKEKLIEEKLQTELQLLKAQINPHFLFNALNNIYSLTYLKSEKAPESVLKLSDMLRYVTDDCSLDRVALRDEISYIRNYIDFNRLRFPGERKVSFESPSESTDTRIAPMLFIPFIENCFKYSRIEEDSGGFIVILLTESEGKVHFSASNSVFRNRPILKGSGKGIENVKQRLDILYPGKYKLNNELKENTYFVELEIDLA